jgi:hypothetical protein
MYTRLLLLATLLVAPLSLVAQDSTARPAITPFRRGQWAAQFSVGAGFSSIGFLKFRSPTRALILDLRLGGSHRESSLDDSTGSHFLGLDSDAFTQVRFGWRGYRGGATKVVTHYTFGALAGFDHSASRTPSNVFQDNSWTWGLFGDLGATYLVTTQLGLGALASASIAYTNGTTEQSVTGTKFHHWQIGGSAVGASLVATLFF